MIVEPTEREHRITLEVRDASGNLAELTLGTIGTPDQVEGPDSPNGSSGGTDQSLTDPSQERGLPSPDGRSLHPHGARGDRSDEPRASCEVQMFGITRDELTPCGM